MRDNKISTTISRPIAEVFEFTINPKNTPLWIKHLKEEEASEYPPKIGTTYSNSADLVSWDEYEVTDFEDNKIFELTSKDGIYHVKYTYTENEDGSTNMEYFEWVDEGKLSNPFTQSILEVLKQILEKETPN